MQLPEDIEQQPDGVIGDIEQFFCEMEAGHLEQEWAVQHLAARRSYESEMGRIMWTE